MMELTEGETRKLRGQRFIIRMIGAVWALGGGVGLISMLMRAIGESPDRPPPGLVAVVLVSALFVVGLVAVLVPRHLLDRSLVTGGAHESTEDDRRSLKAYLNVRDRPFRTYRASRS